MNILEIGIEHGTKLGIRQGTEIGIRQGISQGEHSKLCSQVRKKLEKGLSVTEIADILEESVDTITGIVSELQTL